MRLPRGINEDAIDIINAGKRVDSAGVAGESRQVAIIWIGWEARALGH